MLLGSRHAAIGGDRVHVYREDMQYYYQRRSFIHCGLIYSTTQMYWTNSEEGCHCVPWMYSMRPNFAVRRTRENAESIMNLECVLPDYPESSNQ